MLNKKKEKEEKKMTGTTAHAVYYFLRDTHVSHRVMWVFYVMFNAYITQARSFLYSLNSAASIELVR